MRRIIFLMVCLLFFAVRQAYPDAVVNDLKEFQQYNPDGGKYTFVKRYISSLEYFKLNSERIGKKLAFSDDDLKNSQKVRVLIDSLIMDNANLRIARNYIEIYKKHPTNFLMRKVSKLLTEVCNEQIEINNLEKVLLDKLIEVMPLKDIRTFNKDEYISAYEKLVSQKKELLKKLLEASMLTTKILISNKTDDKGNFSMLGITEREKEKLLFMLDEFYGKGYEGIMRDGQTFLQASVVTIRDFLEDPKWKTLK